MATIAELKAKINRDYSSPGGPNNVDIDALIAVYEMRIFQLQYILELHEKYVPRYLNELVKLHDEMTVVRKFITESSK